MITDARWTACVVLLAAIGAINWGLFGMFQIDLIALLTGSAYNAASRVLYILVGIAGVGTAGLLFAMPSALQKRRPPEAF